MIRQPPCLLGTHRLRDKFENEANENNQALIEQFIGMLVPWIASFGCVAPIATSCISELARGQLEIATNSNTKPPWLLDKWSNALEESKRKLEEMKRKLESE